MNSARNRRRNGLAVAIPQALPSPASATTDDWSTGALSGNSGRCQRGWGSSRLKSRLLVPLVLALSVDPAFATKANYTDFSSIAGLTLNGNAAQAGECASNRPECGHPVRHR